jgi:hypothetical protein
MALLSGLSRAVFAQSPEAPSGNTTAATPAVNFGIVSFLQYAAELHEQDGYNAFDVTRGYFDVHARLSPRVRARFTPDVRPTTDASLDTNMALRLEYAYLEADVTKNASVVFGMHETPWLTFEESVNRYRVQGPMFAEREGLIPGPSDVGASVWARSERAEFHVGIYNGEGYGRAEEDKYKSVQGRATVRVFADDSTATTMHVSGFYSYGWYARDRPRNVAIVMGSYEQPHAVVTAQYLNATDNPFIARDVERRGLSFFGEGRQGVTGWAGIGRLDMFDPDATNENDARRRYTFGGAHWSQWGRGRLGIIVTMEQVFRVVNSEKLESRLLAQTHVEF